MLIIECELPPEARANVRDGRLAFLAPRGAFGGTVLGKFRGSVIAYAIFTSREKPSQNT